MFGSTMNMLYTLAVVYLTLQVAAGQSCPIDVEFRSPDDTDLLAEFYRDGSGASQSLPPPGIVIVQLFCLPIYA